MAVKIREVREVSRPGSPLQVHELTLDSDDRAGLTIRDIPDDRFIRAPVTRTEVWLVAVVASLLVTTLAGLAALIALALLAWSLP